MKDIVIATTNEGKINDFKNIFTGYNVVGIKNLIEDFDVEETGTTFEENAVLKSEHAMKQLNKIVIADDSGLEVNALNGAPGVYSARYAGTGNDEDNTNKLLKELEGKTDRSAKFVCVIAVSIPGKSPVTFRGEVDGVITDSPKGLNGFGYDPVFYFPPMDKTTAEMAPEEKAAVSHRRKAIDLMMESGLFN